MQGTPWFVKGTNAPSGISQFCKGGSLGNLLFVNSGSSPRLKPIRVGIEGPNRSKSSIPTFLRLSLAMASARLTGQAVEQLRERYRSRRVRLTCNSALPNSTLPARDDDNLFYIWDGTFLWKSTTSWYFRWFCPRAG